MQRYMLRREHASEPNLAVKKGFQKQRQIAETWMVSGNQSSEGWEGMYRAQDKHICATLP